MAFTTCGVMTLRTRTPAAPAARFAPGARVMLDGHNAYPERGQWGDRLDSVLVSLFEEKAVYQAIGHALDHQLLRPQSALDGPFWS